MDQNAEVQAARAKLFAKFDSRIGGKGTQRRKVKAKTAGVVVNDDKKLAGQWKKMGLNPIPGIEEVNLFTDKGEVVHFKDPKVHASLQANTYAITGQSETKPLQDLLSQSPQVMQHLGQENLAQLRKIVQASQPGGASEDAIPDLGDTNFEDVSKDIEVD